ncbi:hypothetical protein L7F22_033937 [Adiantum nelumboides]|nr:hypothetical protein [Adiantum nelumboides]
MDFKPRKEEVGSRSIRRTSYRYNHMDIFSSRLEGMWRCWCAKGGQVMHTKISKRGLLEKDVIANATISMYSKWGRISGKDSTKLRTRDMNSCDVVSPADFQEGGKQCFWERTEATLQELQEAGHRPSFKAWHTLEREYDNVQFAVAKLIAEGEKSTEWNCTAMMQAVINAKRIKASSMWVTPDEDEKVPVDLYITLIEEYGKLKRAVELNVGDEAANVIDRYAKSGCLSKAQEVVDKLPVRSALTWTALIGGYAEHSCDKEEELKLMGSMKDSNVSELDRKAIKCFKQMKWEVEVSIVVAVMFCLKACSSVSDVDKGQEIHVELVEEGFDSGYLVGSALASGYAKCGFIVEAQGIFDELDTPKVIFGTTLLASHPLHGHACSMTGAIGKRKVHECELHGLLKQDPILGNTWVDVWAKSSSFVRANDKIGAKGRLAKHPKRQELLHAPTQVVSCYHLKKDSQAKGSHDAHGKASMVERHQVVKRSKSTGFCGHMLSARGCSTVANRVELYIGTTPIFDVFNLEADIDKILNERVQLPNGAYLVIEETEALVTIDVNGGAGMLGKNIKSAAILEVNLSAARQIAAELRLRDIGGIIVIDFIDMDEEEHESLVYEEMRKEIQSDRSIISLSEISKLGLMEMTRRRVRPSVSFMISDPCSCCHGTGRVEALETTFSKIERAILRLVANHMENIHFEGRTWMKVLLRVDPVMFEFLTRKQRTARLSSSLKVGRDMSRGSFELSEVKLESEKQGSRSVQQQRTLRKGGHLGAVGKKGATGRS